MSARTSRVLTLAKLAPAAAVVRVSKEPTVLMPIPWGKRDRKTAMVVLQNMAATTPGTVVPWTTREKKLRAVLRLYHFATE